MQQSTHKVIKEHLELHGSLCLLFAHVFLFSPPVRSRWAEDVPPYIPDFYDGWKPSPPRLRSVESPVYQAPLSRNASQRYPPGRPVQEEVRPKSSLSNPDITALIQLHDCALCVFLYSL